MLEKEILLTAEGLKKLEDELDYLKNVRRREVADRIKTAISFGDISENSEYDDAKNEQAFLEGRIAALEKNLRHVRLIDANEITIDQVGIGTTVRLRDLDHEDEIEYTLVGSPEANPMQGRISNVSPVGKSLMGCRVGDVVEVEVPAGILRYEVLEIRR
ncbi:MAG TPA: transcription elongation factor GreA [Firmicutes bacterium]|jgi:transcription elongation factor GreA|nr:transcription elongation factor GreA [Bacillota bacterium]